MYYFVRVNGDTLHNNPDKADSYVAGEPPLYPATRFNAVDYCLRDNFVRIGWPDTGDLRSVSKTGALAKGYGLSDLKLYIQDYLRTFANIGVGNVILMPDKSRSGELYLGRVTKPYYYFHDVPGAPYEHAHRLGVEWLRDENEQPICFEASSLLVGTKGGFWTRAFHALGGSPTGRAAIPFIAGKFA